MEFGVGKTEETCKLLLLVCDDKDWFNGTVVFEELEDGLRKRRSDRGKG